MQTNAEDLDKRRLADGNSKDRGQTRWSVGHGVGKNMARFVGVSETKCLCGWTFVG